ncbi:MAG: DNA polymerase III subunit beta [Patescibacteria group bacterium]|jgi:DNA polymerase-3 subunit beta
MLFVGLQENLKKGLNIIGHITTKNVNLPILNNILIRAENGNIEFVSTNLEIGITYKLRGKIDKEGEFTVDSKLISEYVNLLQPGEKVRIEQKDEGVFVECGNYKTSIRGESAKEFPLIPSIPREDCYSCSIKELKEALSSVVFAVASNENRVELGGVCFSFFSESLNLAATDSYRLAEKSIKIKTTGPKEENKIIVPARTVQELVRILNNLEESSLDGDDEIKLYIAENQILFVADGVELISRLINGNYPDYKQIIPLKSQTEIIVERHELVRAIKATALFSKTGINDVTLRFKKNKMTVSAFSGASGESSVDLVAEINGDDNEITINYKYFLDGLNNIGGARIKIGLINDNQPCVLKPEKENDYLYLVMPIRQ